MNKIIGWYKNDIMIPSFWNSCEIMIYKKSKLLERLLIDPYHVAISNDKLAINLNHENTYNSSISFSNKYYCSIDPIIINNP